MRMPFEGVSKNVLRDAIQIGRLKYDKINETEPILKETMKLCLNTDRTKRPKAGQLAEGLNKIAPKMNTLQFLKQLGLDDEAEELKEKLEMTEKNKEEAVREAEARAEADKRKLLEDNQKAEADKRNLLEANQSLEEKLGRISEEAEEERKKKKKEGKRKGGGNDLNEEEN
eukprot:CAMPEP_0185254290 /NCGR_PEP_ID=MMETSP1359-20130426/3018_1 /TAXON_ID=552665 /ORGANISM="Bigelowiella longifila, Strain CCMP242" /LENGTH=170 /DNA_ID=CAMNT_0027837133 /DNA_START=1 /DNA_END=514 /DNA_ORIENTATION=+